MSDSDDDSLQNNVFTYQNENTTISARGPNVNNTNITGISFRNNVLTSTMHMPVNFERQRYGGSNFDQRSLYYRRETSPMSLRSVPSYGAPVFNRSTYQNGIGSHRSVYNRRGGSPMSMRSIDSTASVSAADIVFAFKNVKFNKYDLRIIKDAYNKLIKSRQRKRIEKRRNLKLFLKGTRRKSGDDSGEQGSDSSISSDDCRSVRTTICQENIPGLTQMRSIPSFDGNFRSATSHKTNVSHFNTNLKEIPMVTDCTDNFKQNTLRNIMTVSRNVSNFNAKEKLNTKVIQKQQPSPVKTQNMSIMTQKDRFTKGFLLPSQRFNKTVAGHTQGANNDKRIKKSGKDKTDSKKLSDSGSDSDQEEIFKGLSVNQEVSRTTERKRFLDAHDLCQSDKKRNKRNSPQKLKNCAHSEATHNNNIPNGKSNEFIFAKPKMPIKKVNNPKKDIIPEKLLAKSRVPPIEEEINFDFRENNKKHIEKESEKDLEDQTQSDLLHSNSDLSLRPSFIKRKLFTQKLDVAEQKNTSCDSVGANSPQNIYSASMRERNKARKLVTSQSCLSREITGEDNNVLDLIHKIVTPDQINNTNVANKTDSCNNRSNDVDKSSKWDISAVIANCDNQDMSDTYTDEEIFNVKHDKNSVKAKKSKQELKKMPQCYIVVQKLPTKTVNTAIKNNNNNEKQIKSPSKDTSKKTVTDCVKSFWDTDFESDIEFNAPSWKTNNIQQNKETLHSKRNNDIEDKKNGTLKKAPITKGVLTVRNCHKDSMLNISLKSNKTPLNNLKDKEVIKQSSAAQRKNNTKVDKNNKDANTSQTGKKKDTVKENVPVVNKNEDIGKKSKTKQCVDYIKDKLTPKKGNKNMKTAKQDDSSDSKKYMIKNSLNNKAEPKQAHKDITHKVNKLDEKNNIKTHKEPMNNGRIQPKRKSKDKSYVQTSKNMKITSNTKTHSKGSKGSAKELASNNTSINNLSTVITRSRQKLLSFNSSQDYSSADLSNLSNRSLRLLHRLQRK